VLGSTGARLGRPTCLPDPLKPGEFIAQLLCSSTASHVAILCALTNFKRLFTFQILPSGMEHLSTTDKFRFPARNPCLVGEARGLSFAGLVGLPRPHTLALFPLYPSASSQGIWS
jgi:hypothetical protein